MQDKTFCNKISFLNILMSKTNILEIYLIVEFSTDNMAILTYVEIRMQTSLISPLLILSCRFNYFVFN